MPLLSRSSLPVWLFLAMVLSVAVARPPLAQAQEQRIAAVVNDDVISQLDVINRVRLIVLSSGQAQVPDDILRRLQPQALRMLVDEQLEQQEAKADGVAATEDDIDSAISRIEQDNKLPAGGVDTVLSQAGVPRAALVAQVRARIAWEKAVQFKMRGQLAISEEEIDQELADIRAQVGKPQYLLGEIFLPADTPAAEADARATADRLVERMRAGDPFPALARQYSQSASASAGGDIGWVLPGQLDPAIDRALEHMQPGQLAGPIRTLTGIHLIVLRDRREVAGPDLAQSTVMLHRAVLPVASGATKEAIDARMAQAQEIAQAATGCPAFDQLARKVDGAEVTDLGKFALAELAPALQQAAVSLPVGKAQAPHVENGAVSMVMVCDRTESGANLPSRTEIRRQLLAQHFDAAARRMLRDLRLAAFIDIRSSQS